MRPTGPLHLGHYHGVLKDWTRLQHEYDCFFCLVDWHALTTHYESSADINRYQQEMAIDWLAAGVSPSSATLFVQSHVPEHAELHLLLSMICPLGWLERVPSYRELQQRLQGRELDTYGFLGYPLLQAADILLYKATEVPVGEDQKQHLELTRDIAQKFNNDFGAPGYFPLPEPLIQGPATRVMSLRDGAAKMSKSDPSDLSRINLTDDADAIANKVRKAKTDMEPLPETVEGLEGRPEAKNLVAIYAALADTTREAVLAEFAGQGFGAFKPKLAELAVSSMANVTAEMRRLMADPAEIDRALAAGAEKAREVAEPTIAEVKKIVGFWQG